MLFEGGGVPGQLSPPCGAVRLSGCVSVLAPHPLTYVNKEYFERKIEIFVAAIAAHVNHCFGQCCEGQWLFTSVHDQLAFCLCQYHNLTC